MNKNLNFKKGKEYIGLKIIDTGVFLVRNSESQQYQALQKILVKDKEMMMQVKAQIELWKRIDYSQYIVKLYDYHTFNDFFLELIFEPSPEGTLKTYLENNLQPLPEKEILLFIETIAKGINHMHSQVPCIVHSNIKIQNILVFGKTLKISGMARCFLESFDPSNNNQTRNNKIYKYYEERYYYFDRPPEMYESLENSYKVTRKVDIWMLGCILYTLIYRKHPFINADKYSIIKARYETPKTNYSQKIMDLLTLLLIPDPDFRPHSEKILELITKWDKLTKIEIPEKFLLINKEIPKESLRKEEKKKELVSEDSNKSGNIRELHKEENISSINEQPKKFEEVKHLKDCKKSSKEFSFCSFFSEDYLSELDSLSENLSHNYDSQETDIISFLDKFRDKLKRTLNILKPCIFEKVCDNKSSEFSISKDNTKEESFKVVKKYERFIEKALLNLANSKDHLKRLKREIKLIKMNFNRDSELNETKRKGKNSILKSSKEEGEKKMRKKRLHKKREIEEDYSDDNDSSY